MLASRGNSRIHGIRRTPYPAVVSDVYLVAAGSKGDRMMVHVELSAASVKGNVSPSASAIRGSDESWRLSWRLQSRRLGSTSGKKNAAGAARRDTKTHVVPALRAAKIGRNKTRPTRSAINAAKNAQKIPGGVIAAAICNH